jgi:hypothetical protein
LKWLGDDIGLLVGGGDLLNSEDVGGNLLLKIVLFELMCYVRLVVSSLRATSKAPFVAYAKGDGCKLRGSVDFTERLAVLAKPY